MIFLGDIAHPFPEAPAWAEIEQPWKHQPIVANLEGALVEDTQLFLIKRKLFNHVSVLNAFQAWNVKVVSLANNHILDIDDGLDYTLAKFLKTGIAVVGAGHDIEQARQPVSLVSDDRKYLFFACGWKTIQCIPAGTNRTGVNQFNPDVLLQDIQTWKKYEPEAFIVLMPHWNIELELYPQPAHRQFAMAAIDAGADAIIGHHPHRVGGIEMYKGKPIAYSLGNWWMPQRVFMDGRLSFGDETLLQLALEWEYRAEPVCHWFMYSRQNHVLTFTLSETCSKSKQIQELTPFADMSHSDYQKWFPDNRVKHKALPVYQDYRHKTVNACKDKYVQMRQLGIMLLDKSGLRKSR